MSSLSHTEACIHLFQLLVHPVTYRAHTHTHTRTHNCSSSLAVCTSSGRPESVIAASVAWTDRRTGDWRWHAPIISGPSAVFAITEDLAEHTESDSGILYSEAISTPTGCTASVGPGLNSTGLGLCAGWISVLGKHILKNMNLNLFYIVFIWLSYWIYPLTGKHLWVNSCRCFVYLL